MIDRPAIPTWSTITIIIKHALHKHIITYSSGINHQLYYACLASVISGKKWFNEQLTIINQSIWASWLDHHPYEQISLIKLKRRSALYHSTEVTTSESNLPDDHTDVFLSLQTDKSTSDDRIIQRASSRGKTLCVGGDEQ